VKVEVDLATVGNEDPIVDIGKALLFEFGELLEEARDMEDDAGADQVLAVGVDESGGEEVEAVRDAIGDCLEGCRMSALYLTRPWLRRGFGSASGVIGVCFVWLAKTYQLSGQHCDHQQLWRTAAPGGRGYR